MKNNQGKASIASFIIVLLFIGIVVYVAINNKGQTLPEDTQIEERVDASQNNMERISKNGDVLVMNYTGRLVDGTVFDSNVDPKFGHVTPFEFTLGAGMVIKGWDEGLVGMKIGEKKTLTIPPEKGYGNMSIGSIPANSTLIFDVELVDIK